MAENPNVTMPEDAHTTIQQQLEHIKRLERLLNEAANERDRVRKRLGAVVMMVGERYLLPRRFNEGDEPEKDALYDAAEWLVSEGHAKWLPSNSTYAPGIEFRIPY